MYAARQTTIRYRTIARWIVPVLMTAMLAIGAGELVNLTTAGSHDVVRIAIGGLTVGLAYAALGSACLYGLPHYRPMRIMLHEVVAPLLRRLGLGSGA